VLTLKSGGENEKNKSSNENLEDAFSVVTAAAARRLVGDRSDRRAPGWIPTRGPRGGPASRGEEHQIQLGHDPTTCDALGTMETKPSVSSDLLRNRPSLFLQTDSAVFSYFFSHVIYFLTWNTLPTADCGACREKVNYLKIKKSSKRSLYNAGR
jgi:hypothetical protein